MAHWAVLISEERYEAERLFHHDTLELDTGSTVGAPAPGEEVLVVADGPQPAVVAAGRVAGAGAGTAGTMTVTYTARCFDAPRPVGDLPLPAAVSPVAPDAFRALAAGLAGERPAGGGPRRTWLVSVDLPIEADSPAEAVRRFWSYVRELGPRELPAFVWPTGDELAMQAYVLGEQANLDPEEDD